MVPGLKRFQAMLLHGNLKRFKVMARQGNLKRFNHEKAGDQAI